MPPLSLALRLPLSDRQVRSSSLTSSTPTSTMIRPTPLSSSPPSRAHRRIDEDEPLHSFIQTHSDSVPYVGQSFSWDCGLACVEMALRARGVSNTSFQELRKMCPTDSVWSIDIAYLLTRYGLRTEYCTVTVGVRPEYRKQEFYRRQLSEDTRRVTRLFEGAARHGVTVVQRRVAIAEIRRALCEDGKLVLVLMDKRLMHCALCERASGHGILSGNGDSGGDSSSSGSGGGVGNIGRGRGSAHDSSNGERGNGVGYSGPGRGIFAGRGGSSGGSVVVSTGTLDASGFLGHYVLLYGYHRTSDTFLFKDPAALRDTCVVSGDTLEAARLAFGTDQDILFIGELEGNDAPRVLAR